MTNREFYVAIKDNENVEESLRVFAGECIAKLDERLAKRKDKPSKKSLENEGVKVAILEAITANGGRAMSDEVATLCDISRPKATSLCSILVREGKLGQTEVKVKGKGKMTQWVIPETENDENEGE